MKKSAMQPRLPVELIGLDSSCTGVEPFSKFDGQQLCSLLIYRPHKFECLFAMSLKNEFICILLFDTKKNAIS